MATEKELKARYHVAKKQEEEASAALGRAVEATVEAGDAYLSLHYGLKPGDRVTNAEKTYVMVKWHRYWGIESKPWMRAKLVKKSGELSEKASTLYSWEKQGSK